jgi:uncharacterized membrane protein YeaQ/YmgE (transglycosylase-associated protein family)
MECLGWIILGLLAGAIASLLMGRRGAGCISNIILGLIGAAVGGFLVTRFINSDFSYESSSFWPSLAVATLGAMALIFLGRLFSGDRR